MTPAASDVAAETCAKSRLLPSTSLALRQDDRVQHDDVGHRDERDHAAADLGAERRPARGQLEEFVESTGAVLLLASAVMRRP